MADFLLELRSEEIPARMQAAARFYLEAGFLTETTTRGLHIGEPNNQHASLTVWTTPRRLVLKARDVPLATTTLSNEIKGPKVSAPAQALEGFLRKTGLTREQLTERDGIYFAITEKPGRATADVLAEAIPALIRAFPWPKSMRWGAASLSTESLRWVRPLSGIVALLDDEVVPFAIDGIASGRVTLGHRFHSQGEIAIASPASYAQQLRAHHVIVHQAEREAIIRERAAEVAAEAGLVLVEDEGLVIENAGLTEWPVPLLGRFDEAFLEVPPEVIQLTARTNQKYFICRIPPRNGEGDHPQGGGGAQAEPGTLANAFICTANIVAVDGGAAIVAGNRKVLAARLSDARFFWEQDRKKTLAEHAEGLSRITFHEKLGTVADKVERVAKLARWLVESGVVSSPLLFRGGAGGGVSPASAPFAARHHPNPSSEEEGPLGRAALADLAEQAARFCKADLVTEMVGEFPELQGLMGGYYARAEGLPDQVADAIRDHYKPVGQGDEVPTAPVTVAVSLADKLDTLIAFFASGMLPSGSKDPFALRRSALGILSLVQENGLRLSIFRVAIETFQLVRSSYLNSQMVSELGKIRGKEIKGNQEHLGHLLVSIMQRFYPSRPMDNVEWNAAGTLAEQILDFFADRLKVQQREAGVRHDLIDAVFALGGEDDLVRLLARVQALQSFVTTEDGTNLLAGYKRAANILKKEGFTTPLPLVGGVGGGGGHLPGQPHAEPSEEEGPTPSPSRKREVDYTPEPAEAALIAALDIAAPQAEAAIAAEDFAGAMAALASLRTPIDAFFEQVTVNDPDPAKRAARLGLLDQFRAAVHKVADFSLIEG